MTRIWDLKRCFSGSLGMDVVDWIRAAPLFILNSPSLSIKKAQSKSASGPTILASSCALLARCSAFRLALSRFITSAAFVLQLLQLPSFSIEMVVPVNEDMAVMVELEGVLQRLRPRRASQHFLTRVTGLCEHRVYRVAAKVHILEVVWGIVPVKRVCI